MTALKSAALSCLKDCVITLLHMLSCRRLSLLPYDQQDHSYSKVSNIRGMYGLQVLVWSWPGPFCIWALSCALQTQRQASAVIQILALQLWQGPFQQLCFAGVSVVWTWVHSWQCTLQGCFAGCPQYATASGTRWPILHAHCVPGRPWQVMHNPCLYQSAKQCVVAKAALEM